MLILFISLFLPSLSIKILSEGSELQEYGLLWSFNTNSTVKCISMSADGKFIAVASGSKVYFLNSEGKILWSYRFKLSYREASVSVSGNGKYVVTLGRGDSGFSFAECLIFDREGHILYESEPGVLSLSFTSVSISDKGDFIRLGYGKFPNDVIEYYDSLPPQKPKWQYFIFNGLEASISSDGNYVVLLYETFGGTRWLCLFNKDGEKLWEYKVGCSKVLISMDGSRIAYFISGEIHIRDMDGKLLMTYKVPIRNPCSVSFSLSPDGKYVVYAAVNETHYSFLIMNDKGEWQWVAKTPVSHACVSSNADYVVAAYETKVLLFAKMNIYTAKVLEEVRSTVLNVKSKGFSVRDAEDLLSQAEAKFNAGFYKEAIELAEKARSLALDIDQDGVLNEEDFAPYTHNSLITMGAAGLIITLILACYAYARSRRGEVYVFDKETGELTVIR
jgi:outer membrane protein assembly factor BamB